MGDGYKTRTFLALRLLRRRRETPRATNQQEHDGSDDDQSPNNVADVDGMGTQVLGEAGRARRLLRRPLEQAETPGLRVTREQQVLAPASVQAQS